MPKLATFVAVRAETVQLLDALVGNMIGTEPTVRLYTRAAPAKFILAQTGLPPFGITPMTHSRPIHSRLESAGRYLRVTPTFWCSFSCLSVYFSLTGAFGLLSSSQWPGFSLGSARRVQKFRSSPKAHWKWYSMERSQFLVC